MIQKVWEEDIPAEVIERTRHSLIDYIAVTCAGAKFHKDKLNRFFDIALPEEGVFNAIGTGRSLVLKDAVFLNGLNAHALDFDDGTNSGIIHLGSPIFSLLIPLAKKYSVCFEKLIRAAIVGYEASYTMAVSLQPTLKSRGFHATGACGIIGATLAATYMLDFNREERFNAFASACIAASGMLKALDDGSELKPYNVAKTSLLALTSIDLALAGFRGSSDPLGGNRGYLKMMVGSEAVRLKTTLLDGSYAIMKTYTKPYASCRYTHPSVEAAISLRKDHNIITNDIDKILIDTYDLAVAGHDHTAIPGVYSAKMSIPFATAVGLTYGKAGLKEFTEDCVRKKELLDLTKKVQVSASAELSESFPYIQAAIVTIIMKNGSEYKKRIDYPKGEPENPLTKEEFKQRYLDLMEYAGISSKLSERIYHAILSGSKNTLKLLNQL